MIRLACACIPLCILPFQTAIDRSPGPRFTKSRQNLDAGLDGPAWTAEGNQNAALFGASVASAGDVDGDGYDDVIVGSRWYDSGQTDEGRAFVYLGSAAGLGASAAWTADGNLLGLELGWAVAPAGDVNGDGFGDVIVGTYPYDTGNPVDARAFVFLGSAGGLATSAAWIGQEAQGGLFGFSVASAGDVNGDGYDDVIVGAPASQQAFVYHGSATGLSANAAWMEDESSGQVDGGFGYSVAAAGDVDGDGFGDVIVGAYRYDDGETNEGKAFVYLGSATGLSSSADWTADGDQVWAQFGKSVASAGDVDGDGFGDVIVGAFNHSNGEQWEGRAFLYLGSAAGLATDASWTAEGEQEHAYFGWSVASAGDVDDDGFGDVIVGAYPYDGGELSEGGAFLYRGSVAGLSGVADWSAEGDQSR
jgi:hypothetical protein